MPAKKKSESVPLSTSQSSPRLQVEENTPWWKEAVIYQIYPRSFQDSNGDGVGDLQGIIDRLDYLKGSPDSLDIDAIWLSPIYPSPMYDFGYDISDFENIDPIFGNLHTFKKLLEECKKRNIKLIMDLVVNHTSHVHPWFIESRSSKDNPKRDWYIWKDPVNGKEPNGWMAAFGGKAWEFDEKTGQYYYHGFTVQQPDLNWRNPEVQEAIFKMIQFWLDMGVDGFRLDVVNYYFKDDEFRDNPYNFFRGLRDYERQYHIYDRNLPETHDILKKLRKLMDSYEGDRMTVGEVFQEPPGTAKLPASYYGKNSDELHMAFNFSFLYCSWNAKSFAQSIKNWEITLKEHDWPNYTLSNHDQRRHFTRYAKKGASIHRAKIAAMMLLTLRGTPFLYYGEEIGMPSPWLRKKYIRDPLGLRYWPLYMGRDWARMPMCWDKSKYSGFSTKHPWLPLPKNFKEICVSEQENDPHSLLSLYKELIKIRKREITLRKGQIRLVFEDQPTILSYLRIFHDDYILVLLNFTDDAHRIKTKHDEIPSSNGMILFSTNRNRDQEVDLNHFTLSPYEGIIIRLL
jgi:alpha-glucosidase